ncbi:porphobilinogen deaminase-like [Diadema antillarum]|uniref:porphobilinogen deaminase-like n=1 Tax=Diadema antillarum TaxID=105358 RepID=UPI003A84AD04
MEEDQKVVRIGSRKSELAMIQTNLVVESLQKIHPDIEFKIVTMETIGDRIQDKPLSSIGESNLFTKELEKALALNEVDMIVHSLKDMPTRLPTDMAIGAISEREDPHDALVLHKKHTGVSIETLPEGSVIGTSSVRRVAQLKRKFPHLVFKRCCILSLHRLLRAVEAIKIQYAKDSQILCQVGKHKHPIYMAVRGNLNTRLRKLDEDKVYDGLILAVAGLLRMGWEHRISQILSPEICKYSVSQGALGVEIKTRNRHMQQVLSSLNHPQTLLRCVAERALLKTLEGGCSAPVAVHTDVNDGELMLTAAVLSLDGSELREEKMTVKLPQDLTQEHSFDSESNAESQLYSSVVAPRISQHAMQEAEALGIRLAKALFDKGAGPILQAAKDEIAERRK